MSGNDDKVLLDLNYPAFQNELFDLDATEIKKVTKTLRKIKGITWNELFRDNGLKWEELKSIPGKYTVRLSQSYRAVVVREGSWMRFQTLHPDHDGAYGKK
ncbi:MAG: hypothetical protein P4L77_04395 [Sulfuriferula sp.]|nr:hypothetical protein [Sulfuriferula sp.]